MPHRGKIKGTFCERSLAPRGRFGKMFWIKKGRNWVLVGCPKGQWSGKRCRVGTQGYKILIPTRGHCSIGRKIVK